MSICVYNGGELARGDREQVHLGNLGKSRFPGIAISHGRLVAEVTRAKGSVEIIYSH